jgi:outer membrane protein assembly factor BamB
MNKLLASFLLSAALTGAAFAQRGNVDWLTENADAQRSAWIRVDAKISTAALQKKDDPQTAFQFLWQMKLRNAPRQLNSLTPPATLDRLIGYRGFRMLGFVGGGSNHIFTIDTDLGRMEWEKRLPTTAPARPGTLACPGGMTTGVVRPALAAIPPSPTGAALGPGRSTPAKSAVGQPGQGAVTLAEVRPNQPSSDASQMLPQRTRVNPSNPPGGQFGAGPFLVHALAGDGRLHSLHLSNGADYEPPVKFLPPGANAQGLIVIDQVAYVTTTNGCGGAADGVWALDLVTKQVNTWKGQVVGSAGPVCGGDGTVYVATGAGGAQPNAIVALEAKTLKLKGFYSAGGQGFVASPVVFLHQGKTLLAGATADGRAHLVDAAKLVATGVTGCEVCLLAATPAEVATGALASWQDREGTRWLLAAGANAVTAWRLADENGALSWRKGWTSRALAAPLTPTIINNVIFITASGEFRGGGQMTAAQIAAKSGRAVIYALDGATGKELWSSGDRIKSFARGGALAGGMGQIYLTTYDGTIYAFGFPMEH